MEKRIFKFLKSFTKVFYSTKVLEDFLVLFPKIEKVIGDEIINYIFHFIYNNFDSNELEESNSNCKEDSKANKLNIIIKILANLNLNVNQINSNEVLIGKNKVSDQVFTSIALLHLK